MANSPAQFIDAVGVPTIMKVTGKTEGAVRVWKHRNMFPPEVWMDLNAAFPILTREALKQFDAEYRERLAQKRQSESRAA